jgi:uncharacterized protein (DUF2236 family)
MMAQFTLPHILQRRIEALAAHLLAPPGAPGFDFASPPGEPALTPAGSVSWRVFANPVTLFVGGVAAVLLELAEPRVRAGVWEHSSFRTEPLARLQRTGRAALVTVYGAETSARAMIAGVNRLHARIAGSTPAGAAYRADDPELLDWVQATALWGFLEAYHRYACPLSQAERDACFAEGAPVAALYGATGAPRSEAEWQALLARTAPSLEPSATLHEFLAIMRRVPALPRLGRPAQLLLVKAAADLLPDDLADRLGLLAWRLKAWERPLAAAMAAAAERLLIRSWPSAQARRRLGLPEA